MHEPPRPCTPRRFIRIALALGGFALLVGCAPGGGGADAGPSGGDPLDGGDVVVDAGDAGPSSEAPCTFNRECPAHERCECADGDCACRIGARGEGRSGVDACQDGNDCESSLCVEDAEGTFTCSGECEDEGDCGPRLPVCADIAFLGRVCVRDPG